MLASDLLWCVQTVLLFPSVRLIYCVSCQYPSLTCSLDLPSTAGVTREKNKDEDLSVIILYAFPLRYVRFS